MELGKINQEFVTDYRSLLSVLENVRKNKQAYSYSYADLEAVYNEIKPKIDANNFIVIQTVAETEKTTRRTDANIPLQKNKAGEIISTTSRTYEAPLFELYTALVHIPSGFTIPCELPLFVDDLDPQSIGSSITYMRRYSLLVLLGIVVDDDDGFKGSANAKTKSNPVVDSKLILPENFDELRQMIVDSPDKRKFYYSVRDSKTLSESQKRELIKIIYPK